VQRVDELLRDAPMFHGMASDHLDLVAGCASNRIFRPGEYLLREGERADSFYVIRRGDVAVETYVPQRGALTLETLGAGDVLGWSWLFPPYRLVFDARAADTVHTVAFDGRCLRAKCEEDHDLGYDLLKRFAEVIVERLQATRMQLLDVYGHVAG
jgi:CRP/FNR family transcriptional regulator, cyclic AMP receptor protein